jgi:type VI secretion system protein ImpG
MLGLYVMPDARDPASIANRNRIEGIESVHGASSDRLVSGMVMRGREITIKIRDDHFAGRGDLYLFGCVLDTLLGNYASINSYTSLKIKDMHGGISYTWSPRQGNRPLI